MAYRKGARIIAFTSTFPPFIVLYHMMLSFVRIYDWLIYGIRIRGRENLSRLNGAILVSNHTLLFDPGIIAHAIRPRRTYFTMLEETALIPYLGTFVRLLGGVPIPEHPGALRVLDAAARSAMRGLGLIHFFPEGECYVGNQDIRPFRPGAFLLACRLGVPIVPITTVLHERRWFGRSSIRLSGKTLRLPPRITIAIGQPVHPPSSFLATHAGQPDGFALKSAARGLGRQVHDEMQAVIDREGGSRTLYRGMMPRLVKRPDAAENAPARTGEVPASQAG